MNIPKILEVTLRDGSYCINFQFSKKQNSTLASALEHAGFESIEVGHGLGLGASKKGKGVALETDETYMESTANALNKSKWGMFCIPGIAQLSDLDAAIDYKMNFIRIGTNIEDYDTSRKFIEKSKKFDLTVCSNFMKSYVCTPKKFADYAHAVESWGSDVIYIVDSAGGMLPSQLEEYFLAVKDKCPNIKVGFHGHDNLGLGVANALKAAELGIDIVDTSLQGFGRSAGNTSTEKFISAMMLNGFDMGFDPISVMDLGEKYIQPLITKKGSDSVDTVSGLALFHSSYMPIIEKYSSKYGVDPRRLIVAVCEDNKSEAPEELVKIKAKQLKELGFKGNWKSFYSHYYGREQEY
ncbi:MAG: 4-hydroxy-2-oxopentanoic acid aldolase [Candidatus Marinimicrobia bacterium]|nr:4-hydroxy-2-oxopentanoic acid aldolase [Candidatus Neomarinimicrobiota bacterium]|tara:strand:+ start:19211 stop:20269 length:1059 start_codon:yes stop_codon:yes gene_type:complete